MSVRVFSQGISIPSHGDKQITEFIGNASTKSANVSVAHMLAPPGWTEGLHSTKFDELAIVLTGTLTVTAGGVDNKVAAGQVCWIGPTASLAFSNQEAKPCEYWAMCFPAFSPSLVEF